jgi:hypothetical protein
MNSFLANRWIKAGILLVVIGWGPLFTIAGLYALGLLSDPNPNPIGPGLLFFFTFWPAVLFLMIGAFQVLRPRR